MRDERLVCFYTDDTGQKTKGRYLLLAGVAISHERDQIAYALKAAEEDSGKRQLDWHSSNESRRIAYLERAFNIEPLRNRIFYRINVNAPPSRHTSLRTDAIQAAIDLFAHSHRRAVHHEGLTRANRETLQYELRRRGLGCEVRSARFERYAEVRLADALAGMIAKVKFSSDGDVYARFFRDNGFVEL